MPRPRVACVAALTVVAVVAVVAVRAGAEPDRPSTPLALPDLLQVAIRQSPALSRAVIDIEAARADALAAAGIDDFTLTAAARLQRGWRRFTAEAVALPGVGQDHVLDLDLGLSRGIPLGGTVSAALSAERTTRTFTPTGLPELTTFAAISNAASLKLAQPILRGFGPRLRSAPARRAALAKDAATLRETVEALDLVRDVIVGYWQIASAREVVKIRREGLRLAVEQLRITQREVRAGTVSPTEPLAAEQVIATREQALLVAEVDVSKLSLELRRKAGLEVGKDQIDLTPTTALATPAQAFDVDATIARALRDSPLLALVEATARSAELDVEVTGDATRPRLDFVASLGSVGTATRTSDALRQLAELANPTFTLALSYEQQIGARAARGAHDKAKALRRRASVDLEEARREVATSVAHAIDLLRAAQQRIEVGDRAIALATKNHEIQEARFLNGKATSFDVLLRLDELQQAQLARALAVADALAAETTINALTGELLDRYHIRIAPR